MRDGPCLGGMKVALKGMPPRSDRTKDLLVAVRDRFFDGINRAWTSKAGVSDAAVRNYLAGRSRSLTLETAEKLAAAIGLTASEMLSLRAEDLAQSGAVPLAPPRIEVVKDPNEIALLDFWRGRSDASREAIAELLSLPPRKIPPE